MDSIITDTLSYGKAYIWSLVLYAADIPHVMVKENNNWLVKVSAENKEKASQEINFYEEENANWPPPKTDNFEKLPSRNPPTVLFMGLLALFYAITGPWAANSAWFQAGAISSRKIFENGEWWRLATALTLHADPVHLLGNVIIGGIVIHFLCKMTGTGLGWLLILLSGVVGNLINVLLRSPDHLSVGFSTAVFGAVGVLSGMRISSGPYFRGLLLPMGAGGGLLALLGTEGQRTDLGAHLWGFAVGLLFGLLAVRLPGYQRWSARQGMQLLVIICFLGLGWSWWLAFNR